MWRHVNPTPAAWHLWRVELEVVLHLPGGLGAQGGQDCGPGSLDTFISIWGGVHAEHTDVETHLDKNLHCLEVTPLCVHCALRDATTANVYLCPSM